MKISVIIRTYNEAEWLAYSLDSVMKQSGLDEIKIFIVDSGSSDRTLTIANAYKKFLSIEIIHYEGKYLPGKSLNAGVLKGIESKSDFVLILSAHCVIQDQNDVAEMIKIIQKNETVRTVYGRQLPLEFSDPIAWRDMTHLYQSESRLIKEHPTLNNAFSVFSIDAFKDHLFNNDATNLEDVLWAYEELKKGHHIFYSSNQCVSHHHGPNHSNDIDRLKTSINVIKSNSEIFGTKVSKLGFSEMNIIKVAFIQTLKEYEKIFRILSKDDTFIYCDFELKKSILKNDSSLSLFIERKNSNQNRSLHKEYEFIQEEIIHMFPQKKYLISYDGTFDNNHTAIANDALILEIENTFSDVIWPVIPDNSRILKDTSSSGGYNGARNKKEKSYRILRGNGTAIKISKMNNLTNISYSTINLTKT